MVDIIEKRVQLVLDDPVATASSIQNLLDAVDTIVDDIATANHSAYRPSPAAIAQAQRLRAARGRLVDKLDAVTNDN